MNSKIIFLLLKFMKAMQRRVHYAPSPPTIFDIKIIHFIISNFYIMDKNFKKNEEQYKVVNDLFDNGTLTSKGPRPSMPIQVGTVLHFTNVEPAEFQGNSYLNFVCTGGRIASKHLIRTGNGLDGILEGMDTDKDAILELASLLPFSVRVKSLTKDYRDNPIYKFDQFQQPEEKGEEPQEVEDAEVVEEVETESEKK